MNIYRKIFLIVSTMILIPGCACATEQKAPIDKTWVKHCEHAIIGDLNLDLAIYNNPSYNSYLFDCAISPYIGFIGETYDSMKIRLIKKRKLADIFITKKLDINYKDEDGGTLLMSVVISPLPKKWKLNTVKVLIDKGSDISIKNDLGTTAIDMAKFNKETELLKIFSKNTK